MRSLIHYFQERFPIIPVLIYSLGYGLLVVGLQPAPSIWQTQPVSSAFLLITVICMFTLFLLRQRTVDEFRDFAHDAKYFPNRPLQRGLITKQQLVILGMSALALEVILAATLAPLWWYLPPLLFSILMAKDFFCKSWLERHFTSHFFLHEVFFILLGSYFIAVVGVLKGWQIPIGVLGLVAAPMSAELVRKFAPRYDTHGKPVNDSYSVVWGRGRTVAFMMLLNIIIGLSISLVKLQLLPVIMALLIVSMLWIFKSKTKWVIVIGVVQYLTMGLLANLIW